MGRFDSKVVFITGGARGQGRSHAITFAEEGADIVLFDVPGPTPTITYEVGTIADLRETQAMVTAIGRRCLAIEGDVRSFSQLSEAVGQSIDGFGQVDIPLANAGIASYSPLVTMTPKPGAKSSTSISQEWLTHFGPCFRTWCHVTMGES